MTRSPSCFQSVAMPGHGHARRSLFTLMLALSMSAAVLAQTTSKAAPPPGLPQVTTTRILAVGTLTSKATTASLKPLIHAEVRDTVKIYLDGKLDQWYFKPDDSGVVFILNVTDLDEARALLHRLPLGQAGLMDFELTRLAPLSPLGVLMPD